MSKIIIENRCEFLSDETALELVQKVIQGGRVSNNNKQYCYLTRFNYGDDFQDFTVATDLNKKSDRFVIYNSK